MKAYQHKMSKRTELMNKLIKIKHKVEKTTPFNVPTKKSVDFKDTEDLLINEFILKNKEIKKITKELKKARNREQIHKTIDEKDQLKGTL